MDLCTSHCTEDVVVKVTSHVSAHNECRSPEMPISESLDNTKVLRITFDVLHEVTSHKQMQLLLGFPLRTSTLTAKYGTRNFGCKSPLLKRRAWQDGEFFKCTNGPWRELCNMTWLQLLRVMLARNKRRKFGPQNAKTCSAVFGHKKPRAARHIYCLHGRHLQSFTLSEQVCCV